MLYKIKTKQLFHIDHEQFRKYGESISLITSMKEEKKKKKRKRRWRKRRRGGQVGGEKRWVSNLIKG